MVTKNQRCGSTLIAMRSRILDCICFLTDPDADQVKSCRSIKKFIQSELEILVTNFVLYTVVFTVWFEEININFKYTVPVPNFLKNFLHVLTALLFSGAHVTWRTAAWASSGKEKTPGLEFITRGFLNYHFETEEFFCWTDHKLYLKFILLLGMDIQICWTTINPIPPLLWEYARHWEIV